ncbi:MAG TPA: hypothetical protein VF595_14480 [Tepidisphaeraceae bacterium]|jgi:hypothetical protein
MKIKTVIGVIQLEKLPADALPRLKAIGLPVEGPLYGRIVADEGDPRLDAVVALLRTYGHEPWIDPAVKPAIEYYIGKRREFDAAEIDAYRLFHMNAEAFFDRLAALPDGTTIIDQSYLEEWVDAGIATNGPDYVVSDRVRRAFEAGGLQGLSFRRPQLVDSMSGDEEDWDAVGGQWWQLDIPTLIPAPDPRSPADEGFADKYFRYPAKDLELFERQDLMLAGCPAWFIGDEPQAICSPRLRKLSTELKLKVTFEPVFSA